ncbi:MAG: polymerase-3 subunit delta [Verrucomicrobiaceae bacterium]|nr:polymerase-3 subunit delta [Verrucomicrobiaceae bacterium]
MPFKAERGLELMQRAIKLNRLAHAYLISGPQEADREGFATQVLNLISGEQCRTLDDWAHQGYPIISPESKSRRITIETMREMERMIHLKAGPSGHKFGVIVDAERMTMQAQNAFLKTLEEPPPGTVLLLLTGKPQELLTTILSRVIEMPLLPESGARKYSDHERKLLAILEKHFKLTSSSMSIALGLKAGFEEVMDALRGDIEEDAEDDFEKEKELYGKTTDSSAYLKGKEEHMKALIEATYLHQRDGMLELLLAWMGDIVRHKVSAEYFDLQEYSHATKQAADRWTIDEASRRLRTLRKLEQHLHTNVSETLALEVGFIEAFG